MSRFLVPSLDRGGLSLYGLAGGPEYYLDADNSRCGTTGARSFDGEQYVELGVILLLEQERAYFGVVKCYQHW
jgi:hypothetical protein